MATRATLVTIPPGTTVTKEAVEPFATPAVTSVMVGITVTAVSGTSPNLQPYLEVLGSDNVWYTVWKPAAITAVGQTVAVATPASAATVNTGMSVPVAWSNQARLRFEVTGTTPSFTLSADVHGQ